MMERVEKVVHIDHEEKMSLDQAIAFLETIVTKLKEEKSFTLTQGDSTYQVRPSSQVELEVKVEQRGDHHKFEFELEWSEGEAGKNEGLKIG